MSNTTERDTHFFLAGWNGHAHKADSHQHFRQAASTAPSQCLHQIAEPAAVPRAASNICAAAPNVCGSSSEHLAQAAHLDVQKSDNKAPQAAQAAVPVPRQLLERVIDSLLSFTGGQDWAQSDMDAFDDLHALLSTAPAHPAEGVPAPSESDSICAWTVWWTHSKSKFTTPRQSALAAWNYANERALRAIATPAAPAAPAADALTLAELLELRRAADDFIEGCDTDVDHDLLARGAIAGYLFCDRFSVLDSDALDAAIAARAAQGGV